MGRKGLCAWYPLPQGIYFPLFFLNRAFILKTMKQLYDRFGHDERGRCCVRSSVPEQNPEGGCHGQRGYIYDKALEMPQSMKNRITLSIDTTLYAETYQEWDL